MRLLQPPVPASSQHEFDREPAVPVLALDFRGETLPPKDGNTSLSPRTAVGAIRPKSILQKKAAKGLREHADRKNFPQSPSFEKMTR